MLGLASFFAKRLTNEVRDHSLVDLKFSEQFMTDHHPKQTACGLDFGTSNSAIGYFLHGQARLTQFDNRAYIPSAIFFDYDKAEPLFGTEAIERYVDGAEGRMIWSPKNALGTGLIAEKTLVKGKRMSFKDIITLIVSNLKKRCEEQASAAGQSPKLDSVVCGRPVFFNDDDKELDNLAQDSLKEILNDVGFKYVQFVYEPIAAAIHYAELIDSEQIALVVDMGGGTSDFTLVKLGLESKDILSVGGIHVAGTDFDRQLSLKMLMPELGMGSKYKSLEGPWLNVPPSIYFDLATWHKIGFVYSKSNMEFVQSKIYSADTPEKFERLLHVLRYRYGHFLARLVERAKIELSDKEFAQIASSEIKPAIDLSATRRVFEEAISEHVSKITATVQNTIAGAGVSPSSIDAVFMTGGSSLIPSVRQSIMSIMPNARIVEGDKFGSVAMGLTLAANLAEANLAEAGMEHVGT